MPTVYVRLSEEAVEVWRPVEAVEEGDGVYRLNDAFSPDGETWEFPPGSRVRCETRDLHEGPALVAVERIAGQ